MTAIRTIAAIALIALGAFLIASVSAIPGAVAILAGVFLLPWYSSRTTVGGPIKLPGQHRD
jgi:hypothetical protein